MARLPSRRGVLGGMAGLSAVAAGGPTAAQPVAAPRDAALAELAQALGESRRGHIIRPGAAGHDRIRAYNGRFDCLTRTTYVMPTTAEGVQDVISWANRHERSFAIRGGGHSFEGKSSHPDLVVDLSKMTALDFKDGLLRAEAGVRLGEVYRLLTAAGHVLPGGTCPTVGLAGHALGGGIGDFLPMFGYAAQSLMAVRLVTMGGHMLTISDDGIKTTAEEALPDRALTGRRLMTLLRGGGQGTFGIVTDLTFKAHNVRGARLASFRLDARPSLSAQQTRAVIEAWQGWRLGLSPEMQSLVSAKLNLGRSGSTYSIDISGLVVIRPDAGIAMPAVRQALDPLFRRSELASKQFRDGISLDTAIRSFLDTDETTRNPRRRMLYGSSSVLAEALPPAAVQHLVQAMTPDVFVSLYTSGGVSNTVEATALHPSQFLVEWAIYKPRRDADAARRLRALAAEVVRRAGFPDHAFANYPDGTERNYSPEQAEIARLGVLFDPKRLCTSSLFGKPLPGWPESACR